MLETIKFELQYRLKRPATYIYFLMLFALAIFLVTTDVIQVSIGQGKVAPNAAFTLTFFYLIFVAIGMLVISAVMGVPVVRDFEHNSASLIFTTSIKKWQYLGGRFIGSFLILVFIFLGPILGMLFGQLSPWAEKEQFIAFNLYNYIFPYLQGIPALFILGSIFFMGGALSRKITYVYVIGVLVVVLYLGADSFTSDIENEKLAALFDPFGIGAFFYETQYWTTAEKNTLPPPTDGVVALYRMVWLPIALLCLTISYFFFNFNIVRDKKRRKAKKVKTAPIAALTTANFNQLPKPSFAFGFANQIKSIGNMTGIYFQTILKSIPFLAIVLMGLGLILISAINMGAMYGTQMLATTYLVLNVLLSFSFFYYIIIVYYTGELIWQERDVKFNLIHDATPVKNFSNVISKFLAMVLIFTFLNVVLIGAGIFIQVARGFTEIDLMLYIKGIFGANFINMLMISVLALLIHTIVNHKFVGHAIVLVFLIFQFFMGQLGLEHNMFQFASGSLGQYSEMNGYKLQLPTFSWYKVYWLMFSILLFVGIALLASRGAETMLKMRWRMAQLRFARPVAMLTITATCLFLMSGCYIFYNNNIVNKYQNSDTVEEIRANYEKELKQFEHIAQPKITATYMEVDIFPNERAIEANGFYLIKNKTNETIKQIHLQKSSDEDAKLSNLKFEGGATSYQKYEDFGYEIFTLNEPMQPGEERKMEFSVVRKPEGFKEGGTSRSIVENGTFFNNTNYFPSFGYDENAELGNDSKREEYDLPEKERMMKRDDPRGLSQNLFGDDADHIDFEIVLSTTADQTAIAPGYLQRAWEEGGRKYFHYKMDAPMCNFYSVVSAKYEVIKEEWVSPEGKPVQLEIYYHQGHEFNLDRMMKGMKESLTYYSENFSPYQYRQLRIMEFPRYRTFAQSFANTVPFSEGIGFMQDAKADDVDFTFYVTAHEVAHQWWGHQVTEAGVQGSAMLSESLSQYSALMVMKKNYSREMMQQFLKHECDRYLLGRSAEQKKEQPIVKVEGQQYIHYNKGSLLLYALQDFIGEENVNAALRNYIAEFAWVDENYPTTFDLMRHLGLATPDSLQYLITDMFEKITLYENRMETVEYTKLGKNKFEVSLKFNSKKYEADSLGNETLLPLNDWIDVGIYNFADSLVYYKKHQISNEVNELTIPLSTRPNKAGIDPLNIFIDRTPDDNVKIAVELEQG